MCVSIYICIYKIYIFSIDNYIQVMKHRIYNFPLRAEEKQIHTQFTEEVPQKPSQMGAEASLGDGGHGPQQKSQPSRCCLSWWAGGCR